MLGAGGGAESSQGKCGLLAITVDARASQKESLTPSQYRTPGCVSALT